MLTISNNQLAAFHEAAVTCFAAKIAQALADEFSAYDNAAVYNAANFMQLSRDGIVRGIEYGLEREGHLLAFVKIGAVLGLGFYDLPTTSMIMRDPILTAEDKIWFLIETIQFLLARQAEGGGDDGLG